MLAAASRTDTLNKHDSGHFLYTCDTQSRGHKMSFSLLSVVFFCFFFLRVGVRFAWLCFAQLAMCTETTAASGGGTDESARYITAALRVSVSAAEATWSEPVQRPRLLRWQWCKSHLLSDRLWNTEQEAMSKTFVRCLVWRLGMMTKWWFWLSW